MHIYVQCLGVVINFVTRNCLSDEILHYWLIGLLLQVSNFTVHQQNSSFGGNLIWPLYTVINQPDAGF